MKLSNIAPKIVDVRFAAQPSGMVTAVATFEDGARSPLFTYNQDELGFTVQELVGLTRDAAKQLKDWKLDSYIGL